MTRISDAESGAQEVQKRIRDQARGNRRRQENKEELSRVICGKVLALPEYAAAKSVLFYVDVRDEVRTRASLAAALTHGKTIVVPWCNDKGELELFDLECMDDLAAGMYGILEPKVALRSLPERQVSVDRLDLILVPGVAFTRAGARMGHGKGYYDKLLERAPTDAMLIGLAFECQLFPDIPTRSHDVFMHKIVTEAAIYGD